MDPRIITAEELARYEADATNDLTEFDCGPNDPARRILALIEHGKALAEQVEMLSGDESHNKWLADEANRHMARAEKAEADATKAAATALEWADAYHAAEQRLADRDKAIARAIAECDNAEDEPDWVDPDGDVWIEVAVVRRALLTEDGAS